MKLRGKLPGLNYTPKLWIVVHLIMYIRKFSFEKHFMFFKQNPQKDKLVYIIRCTTVVEEHSIVGRSIIERICGRDRRENAGISSERMVRIHPVESLRFPGEGSSAQGKSGPKERPKGVSDGQQV